ncbi:MAG: archaemetzincin family Zn-dependent metalloprotease [Promethearchaeota archaeon]
MNDTNLGTIHLRVVFFGNHELKMKKVIINGLVSLFSSLSTRLETCRVDVPGLPPVYNRERKQYASGTFIMHLQKSWPRRSGWINIGVFSGDLYSDSRPGLNFIFGEAQLGGHNCVISTYRLHENFYGRERNEPLYIERVMKEALHEIGHVIGLHHCKNDTCVMHFSNAMEDTDFKKLGFCTDCLEKYEETVRNGKKR